MKTRGIEIRPLGIADLRAVFVLGTGLFSGKKFNSRHVWNEKVLAEILARSLELSLIALRKKSVAGFLIGTTAADNADERPAEIVWIGVRDRGHTDLEHDLIEAFVASCAERNIRSIRIEAPGFDSDLIEICQKCGFSQTGHIVIMENIVK